MSASGTPRPPALLGLDPRLEVPVDVRADIREGREPLGRIMAHVKALRTGEVLVLRAPFEPLPLYHLLGRRGFAHWAERRAADDWSVWFFLEAADGSGVAAPLPGPASTPAAPVSIDVRGLEPPRPLVAVLEALDRLGPGDRLQVVLDRRPVFLYPQLDDRGFAHETEEPAPGVVRILIRRDGHRS
jgi:uncharacterized protein (DUF2249 family)